MLQIISRENRDNYKSQPMNHIQMKLGDIQEGVSGGNQNPSGGSPSSYFHGADPCDYFHHRSLTFKLFSYMFLEIAIEIMPFLLYMCWQSGHINALASGLLPNSIYLDIIRIVSCEQPRRERENVDQRFYLRSSCEKTQERPLGLSKSKDLSRWSPT